MDIIHSVSGLRERLQREPNNVFVPTMGNLHEGHIQLIKIAKPRAACTVVSIFVNRLQFGPREDFDRYPRTLEEDSERLKAAGVDVVFAPDEKEIYPEPQTFVVEPSDLQHILEGAHRPGHFRGVATVVLKLFNLVMPHSAIFGKKDYQQYLVLRDMVRQFALPIEIIPAETVRAPDGLALSSRNALPVGRGAPRGAAALPAAEAGPRRDRGRRARLPAHRARMHVASSPTTAGIPTTSRCAGRPTCSRRQRRPRAGRARRRAPRAHAADRQRRGVPEVTARRSAPAPDTPSTLVPRPLPRHSEFRKPSCRPRRILRRTGARRRAEEGPLWGSDPGEAHRIGVITTRH